jgi:hypothetical protein
MFFQWAVLAAAGAAVLVWGTSAETSSDKQVLLGIMTAAVALLAVTMFVAAAVNHPAYLRRHPRKPPSARRQRLEAWLQHDMDSLQGFNRKYGRAIRAANPPWLPPAGSVPEATETASQGEADDDGFEGEKRER